MLTTCCTPNFATATCYSEVPGNPTTLSARVNSGLWTGPRGKWSACCPQHMGRSSSLGPGRSFIPRIRESNCHGFVRECDEFDDVWLITLTRPCGEPGTRHGRERGRRRFAPSDNQLEVFLTRDWDKLTPWMDGHVGRNLGFLADVCQAKPSGAWGPWTFAHIFYPTDLVYFIYGPNHTIQNTQDRDPGLFIAEGGQPLRRRGASGKGRGAAYLVHLRRDWKSIIIYKGLVVLTHWAEFSIHCICFWLDLSDGCI